MSNDKEILPEAILDAEVKKICARYKITPARVKDIIRTGIVRYPNLVSKIKQSPTPADIIRIREYKRFIKAIKKQIYYDLRQYHNDKEREFALKEKLTKQIADAGPAQAIAEVVDELLAGHVSTRERAAAYIPFYRKMFATVGKPKSIIDIGCGLHPLSYPFEAQKNHLRRYVAIDKDPLVIDTLNIFKPYVKPIEFVPLCLDIGKLSWSDVVEQGETFDLAFMLKLIPVLTRHNADAMQLLAGVPAHRALITGNIEAMTRRDKIKRREEKILKKFINASGKSIIDMIEIGNEFGFFIM